MRYPGGNVSGDFPSDVELPKVEIHATDVCNNRCSFCTTGWLMREQGEDLGHPPRAVLRMQLEEAYAKGARRALFQGGEPTIRRDLGDLLADAHAIGYQATTIFTNARMAASRAGARWLAAMNVTWFQISIQGGTAEAHDASVGAKGAFEQTVLGARRLIEAGQRVKINAVLTVHLLDTIREFAALMIDLRPEEIGLDTVKPSGAFEESRESYAALVPRMSSYSAAIREAMISMDQAGIVARLTSFPACLAPGAEHLIAEEAGTTQTQQHRGNLVDKQRWKRSMQVKGPRCGECAHDATCGGVYGAYAALHGLDELVPLLELRRPAQSRPREAPDSPFTRALRAMLVRGAPAAIGVSAVQRLPDDSHELTCFAPAGESTVLIAPRSDAPAYAHTARFSVRYRAGKKGARPDERLLAAIVKRLERAEESLRRTDEPAPPPHDLRAGADED
jgi:pyruvate-formate lyase-activating enzyme